MGKNLLENINCKEVHNTVLITSDDSFSAPAQETCLSESKDFTSLLSLNKKTDFEV